MRMSALVAGRSGSDGSSGSVDGGSDKSVSPHAAQSGSTPGISCSADDSSIESPRSSTSSRSSQPFSRSRSSVAQCVADTTRRDTSSCPAVPSTAKCSVMAQSVACDVTSSAPDFPSRPPGPTDHVLLPVLSPVDVMSVLGDQSQNDVGVFTSTGCASDSSSSRFQNQRNQLSQVPVGPSVGSVSPNSNSSGTCQTDLSPMPSTASSSPMSDLQTSADAHGRNSGVSGIAPGSQSSFSPLPSNIQGFYCNHTQISNNASMFSASKLSAPNIRSEATFRTCRMNATTLRPEICPYSATIVVSSLSKPSGFSCESTLLSDSSDSSIGESHQSFNQSNSHVPAGTLSNLQNGLGNVKHTRSGDTRDPRSGFLGQWIEDDHRVDALVSKKQSTSHRAHPPPTATVTSDPDWMASVTEQYPV